MIKDLVFKQVRAEGGCISFIFGDLRSKKACIIDPRFDQHETYLSFLEFWDLKAALVIDTHTHADHYSGSHLIARDLGAQIAMSEHTASARPGLKLADGQWVELGGQIGLQTIHTPGHTPDSVSLLLDLSSVNGGKVVFTGDTLFIGGGGRTDFPGASPEAHFDSVQNRLGALDDKVWVMPGHDYSGLLFSTIGEEKKSNAHFTTIEKSSFLKMKQAELLDAPGILQNVVEFNQNAAPRNAPRGCGAMTMCATASVKPVAGLARQTPNELQALLAQNSGILFVDVREREEYARGHIPGVRNIPMSELFLHWSELASASQVLFTCQGGSRSLLAAQSVHRLGQTSVSDLNGGYAAWARAGLPTQT